MAVEWTEPRIWCFEISLLAMTHQQHLEKMQVDKFFAEIGAGSFLYLQ